MTHKHTPTRMCTVCRTTHPKAELIRIVKNKNGEITVDPSQKADGRGCYICKDAKCLEKFIKSKALNRAYKKEISQDIYEQIKKEFEKFGRK